jgi:hypothetical protein
MEFRLRTEVNIIPGNWKISHSDTLLLMGSCFTDNIGTLLQKGKIEAMINPFGVSYNPASMCKLLIRSLNLQLFSSEELVFSNGLWHSMELHGSFSGCNKEEVVAKANSSIEQTHEWLKKTDYLMLTIGSSWVYQFSGSIVNNCHKIPTRQFQRRRLLVEEVVALWQECFNELFIFNPRLKIIFTVSPIRHVNDGAVENQLSKSVLLLAIDQLVSGIWNDRIHYFPSYEIVMDDLRDYRFYADDMVHLNETAIRYIFDKFKLAYFDRKTKDVFDELVKIDLAINHRIMNNNREEIARFCQTMIGKIDRIMQLEPKINLEKEKDYFIQKLDYSC